MSDIPLHRRPGDIAGDDAVVIKLYNNGTATINKGMICNVRLDSKVHDCAAVSVTGADASVNGSFAVATENIPAGGYGLCCVYGTVVVTTNDSIVPGVTVTSTNGKTTAIDYSKAGSFRTFGIVLNVAYAAGSTAVVKMTGGN